ncbi:regucalcin-like [Sycon ciliatum]|uniref:regucalcin-like n=1 Tax=Sycon ciliatum TaxID=27933 RepID=UPI0031F665BB
MPLPKPDISNAKVEPVVDQKMVIGEGPHWDEPTQTLVWVDIYQGLVMIYDPATGVNKVFDAKEQLTKLGAKDNRLTVGAAIPIAGQPGKLLLATGNHIGTLDTSSGEIEFKSEYSDGTDDTRFNDAKCDPSGRLWAGSMSSEVNAKVRDPEAGNLYLVDKGFAVSSPKDSKFAIANGLAWSADEKTMYFVDSTPGAIYAYDYDNANGTISNRRTLLDTSGLGIGFPDGMCIDSVGRLWVAGYASSGVHCIDPTAPDQAPLTIKIPNAKCVTSCCFGGKNLDELYVTTGGRDDDDVHAGKLHRITNLGATGFAGQPYIA